MKILKWEIISGIVLILFTVVLTVLHYLIFHDLKTLFFYLMEDIVFLPVQILLVTLMIGGLLSLREKQVMMKKMNMVIEVFYSEVGKKLLKHFFEFDQQWEVFHRNFLQISQWSDKDFRRQQQQLKDYEVQINCQTGDLEKLRYFLLSKRNFLLRLLENPNLLEHETFTDLLWAVFHLTEELLHRKNCHDLCELDRGHLVSDIQRAYILLIYEWLSYMNHLKKNYQHLFSLSARLNPFNPEAMAELSN